MSMLSKMMIKKTSTILVALPFASAFAFTTTTTTTRPAISSLSSLLARPLFSQRHNNFIRSTTPTSHRLFSTTSATTIKTTEEEETSSSSSSSYPPPPPNCPYPITKQEWYQRCALAVSYRIACMEQWDMVIFNHITIKVHGSEHEQDGPHFLINNFGMGFDEVTASSLLKVTLSGKQIPPTGDDDEIQKGKVFSAGYVLHSAIHAARHDVEAIWHCHSLASTALSQTKIQLLPLGQEAAFVFNKGIAYHPFEGTANDVSEQPRIVSNLGLCNKVLMLENHGPLVACESIEEAYATMFFVTRACEYQVRSLSAVGGDLEKINVPDGVVVDQMLNRIDKLGDVPVGGTMDNEEEVEEKKEEEEEEHVAMKEEEEEEVQEEKHDIEKLMFDYAKRAAERKYGAHDIYR